MKFLSSEYLIVTMIFMTLYYTGLEQQRRTKLVPVKNLRHLCKTELERNLYDALITQGLYARPAVKFGFISIPLALEQYKVAIFLYSQQKSTFIRRFFTKHKELYLRSIGWKVLKFSNEPLHQNIESVKNSISPYL